MNIPGPAAAAASTEPITSAAGVDDEQPPLRQELRELHRQHSADCVASIGQARGQAERLRAHMQLSRDDRCERLDSGG